MPSTAATTITAPAATAVGARLLSVLHTTPLPPGVDGLVGELRELETLKCAIEARQAAAALALEEAMRRRATDAATATATGAPAARAGRGAAEQVAYARRVSPHRGRILLGLAKAVAQMPHLGAAFTAGVVSEWRVMLLAKETACLELADRQRIDTELAGDPAAVRRLEQMGDRQLAGAARRRAAELDAASVVRRRARAESERRVTIRPAPDSMVYLTALLPMAPGVAAYAALKRAADEAVATGATTGAAGAAGSRGQAMADALVQRVTGVADATSQAPGATAQAPGATAHASGVPAGLPVTVNLAINEDALLGDSEEPGYLEAAGQFHDAPASLVRDLITRALDEGEQVALRRLFTAPTTGQLVAMESTSRLFPPALARFIRLRDRVCRTPWCDAPIRHLDHRRPWAHGGATTAENGQGLCEQCNHARQSATIPTGAPPPIRRPSPPAEHEPPQRRRRSGLEIYLGRVTLRFAA